MTYTTENFNAHINRLTDPAHGIVEATSIPDVFAIREQKPFTLEEGRPLVVITGPSGVGKGSVIEHIMQRETGFTHVKTACTRQRRPTEAPDEKTWMRARRADETEVEYHARLIEEYDLIEHSAHMGNFYGLPRRNLTSIPEHLTPLLDTDTEAIASLRPSLKGEFNLVAVLLCPESAEQLEARMHAIGRYNESRMQKAVDYVDEGTSVANFVLINREDESAATAIEATSNKMMALLGDLGCMHSIVPPTS